MILPVTEDSNLDAYIATAVNTLSGYQVLTWRKCDKKFHHTRK